MQPLDVAFLELPPDDYSWEVDTLLQNNSGMVVTQLKVGNIMRPANEQEATLKKGIFSIYEHMNFSHKPQRFPLCRLSCI
jgi:hypothetical protein